MILKDIHVHVDNGEVCALRVKAASELARDLDAHLTGIYVRRPLTMPIYADVPVGDQLLTQYAELIDKKENTAHKSFDRITEKYDIATSWREVEGRLDLCLANEALYSDLLVLGQPDPEDALERNRGLADLLLLISGRPCLIVPYIGTPKKSFGKRPLIAWNGSREASRAIHDALPLLELASQVTVLLSNPEQSRIDFGDLPGAMISQHLARHDIKVDVEVLHVDEVDTSDAVLSYVSDNNNDLLVMGAYGHSRLQEFVLGGMTRDILAAMTIPVIMSH